MTGWSVVGATATGSYHALNDDAWRCVPWRDAAGAPVMILAVADGAGSAAHGGAGARAALRAFTRAAAHMLRISPAADLARPHMAALYAQALEGVQRAARARRAPAAELSSTLLAAILTPDTALLAQVGDGAIVHRSAGERWRLLRWPDPAGEFANDTVFLTSARMQEDLQVARVAAPEELALLTDGLQPVALDTLALAPYAKFFESLFAGVRGGQGRTAGDRRAYRDQLGRWLASPAASERSPDDKTLVLCWRAGRAAAPAAA